MNSKTIILTGATGFLGGYILKDLLLSHKYRVICPVRAESEAKGYERVLSVLARARCVVSDDLKPSLRVVIGCHILPSFGLSGPDLQLLDDVALVIHNAASTNQHLTLAQLTTVNVPHEIIAFCARRRCPLSYVSTLGIVGHGHPAFCESDPLDSLKLSLASASGYSQSKWIAESLILRASHRFGFKARIFRPSLLGPDSSGEGIPNPNDWLTLFVSTAKQLNAWPQRQLWVNLLPVDLCSAAIVATSDSLLEDSSKTLDFLHLCNAAGGTDISQLLAHLPRIPYDRWLDQAIAHESPIAPLVSLIRSDWFENQQDTFLTCHQTSEKLLKDGIDFHFNWESKSFM